MCSRTLEKGGDQVYLYGLIVLFSVCGVPAIIVVGVIVLIRAIYVLGWPRK